MLRELIFLNTIDPALAVRRRVLARAFDAIWRIELPERAEREQAEKEIRADAGGAGRDSHDDSTSTETKGGLVYG